MKFDNLLQGYAPLEGLNQDIPRILSIEEFTVPSFHTRVSCCYGDATEPQFNIYLPANDVWKGRFYQHTHPFWGIDGSAEDLAMHFDSGAYSVTIPVGTMGYRTQASAGHVSRTIARNFYGHSGKIYGYLYGGSGGSMQSIGALEATDGLVWDGIMPFITGAPVSMGNFDIRRFARVVLEEKAPLIADAVRPGGSGDVKALLSDMEYAVFEEVSKLGVPVNAWENYEYLLLIYEHADLIECINSTGEVIEDKRPEAIKAETRHTNAVGSETDDTYTQAFWNEPGYLAAYDPALQETFHGLKAKGATEGALAKIAYHRHKDPGPAYKTWSHLRDAKGKPLYAQTEGPHTGLFSSTMCSGGGLWNGKINCKSIMVVNLYDADAFPSDGDYYLQRVKEAGREADFRIWLTENADHHTNHAHHLPYLSSRLVNFNGILAQALRDLSAWVEKGIAPPVSTSYTVASSQLIIEENPAKRGGIQPAVKLTADGADGASMAIGKPVSLLTKINVPPGTGKIISAEWDFYGNGDFVKADFEALPDGSWVCSVKHAYDKAGTYLPQIRVAAQREGDPGAPFTKAYNLGRGRVVVG